MGVSLDRFRFGQIGWQGWNLALCPDRAILKIFLLPYRDGSLEGINTVAACFKSCPAMRRSDGNQDAGLPDLQAPPALNQRHSTGPPPPPPFRAHSSPLLHSPAPT